MERRVRLANNISWAAQFANGIQGGGNVAAPDMFQNLAVTGSAPSDWLPGGLLHDELDAIVAENPELGAFTMGANPLLTDILLTRAGERFDLVRLTSRLQQFYTAVLGAPDSTLIPSCTTSQSRRRTCSPCGSWRRSGTTSTPRSPPPSRTPRRRCRGRRVA